MKIAQLLRTVAVAAAAALAQVAALSIATGEPTPHVLAVDRGTIYIELGGRDGVGSGTQLELLHAVNVRDPRTGQLLTDYFVLGTLEVVKSGDRISVARASDELAPRVAAGDRVRVVSALRRFADPWASKVATSGPAVRPEPAGTPQPEADHAELARQAWLDTLGKSPQERIARWLQLLETDPQGPYRAAVQREIASLKAQIAARDAALARARSTGADRDARIVALAGELATSDAALAIAKLPHIVAGQSHGVELSFLVRRPDLFRQAWLYVREDGQPGYRRIALVADGDAYLRASIGDPRADVDWYVELVTATGETFAGYGTRELPLHIAVSAPEAPPTLVGRSHVDVHVDYVDFDGKLANGFDQYYLAEADFTYRFLSPIHAVRLGFGTLSGTGGPKDVIDLENQCLDGSGRYRCSQVEFSYVYTEFELRLRKNIAVMVRPQAGLLSTDTMVGTAAGRCRGSDVDGCSFFTGLGFRARVRLGEETATNLVLGAGFTQNVGTLLEAAYHWLPAATVPVQLTVQVTDMPVPEDFGVRLIGDVGWRPAAATWFYPSLRLSYQARDIDHAGVSGGLALNFDW